MIAWHAKIPYWMDGAARCGRDHPRLPFQSEPDAAPVRLIVPGRVKPTPWFPVEPSSPPTAMHGLHHRPRWGDAGTGGRSSPSRRDRECDTRPQVRCRTEPHAVRPLRRQRSLGVASSRRWPTTWPGWTARIGLGERIVTTKTLRRRVFALAGRLTRSARRLTLHLPQRWPWDTQFSRALARLRAIPLPACTAPSATDPTSPPTRQPAPRELSLLPILLPSRASQLPQIRPLGACAVTQDPHADLPSTPIEPRPSPLLALIIPLLRSSRRRIRVLRWIRAKAPVGISIRRFLILSSLVGLSVPV